MADCPAELGQRRKGQSLALRVSSLAGYSPPFAEAAVTAEDPGA